LRIVQPAQQLGDRRLAGAVLSHDGERRAGGNGEIEVLQHVRAGASRVDAASGYAKVTSRRRISRAGIAFAERSPERSAPAGRIAGSRRSTAATGAAAPSSAQLNPPNAIIDTPIALCT
jgi:hypothetical protein